MFAYYAYEGTNIAFFSYLDRMACQIFDELL